MEQEEKEFIYRLQQGDERAYRQLFDKYYEIYTYHPDCYKFSHYKADKIKYYRKK